MACFGVRVERIGKRKAKAWTVALDWLRTIGQLGMELEAEEQSGKKKKNIWKGS